MNKEKSMTSTHCLIFATALIFSSCRTSPTISSNPVSTPDEVASTSSNTIFVGNGGAVCKIKNNSAKGWLFNIYADGDLYRDARWSRYGGKRNGTDDRGGALSFLKLLIREGTCDAKSSTPPPNSGAVCKIKSGSTKGWLFNIRADGDLYRDARWSRYGGLGNGTDDGGGALAFLKLLIKEGTCDAKSSTPPPNSGAVCKIKSGSTNGWLFNISADGTLYRDARWSRYGGLENGTDDRGQAIAFFKVLVKEGTCKL